MNIHTQTSLYLFIFLIHKEYKSREQNQVHTSKAHLCVMLSITVFKAQIDFLFLHILHMKIQLHWCHKQPYTPNKQIHIRKN